MKLEDVKVGQEVVYGNRNHLAEGRSGQTAYVVAVGRYTMAWAPCGKIVRELSRQTGSRSIVVALEEKRYVAGQDEPELLWAPYVVSVRQLMDPEEYQVKADAIASMKLEMEAYWARGSAIEERLEARMQELLRRTSGYPIDSVSLGHQAAWRDKPERFDVNAEIDLEQVKDAVIVRELAEYRAWLALPRPDRCN